MDLYNKYLLEFKRITIVNINEKQTKLNEINKFGLR